MAERQGFEPWVKFYLHNRLAGGCLRPTRPPLPKHYIILQTIHFVKKTGEPGGPREKDGILKTPFLKKKGLRKFSER
jgi:hypothetical protein